MPAEGVTLLKALTIPDYGRVLAIAVIWGFSFVAIHLAVRDAPPLLMSAMRFFFTAFPFVFFMKRPMVKWRQLIGYGVFLGVIQFGLLFLAIGLGAPAGLASLLMQLQVFFTVGLSAILHKERPALSSLIGAIIAFGGIFVIGMERSQGAQIWPLLLVILASAAWGVANLIAKSAGNIDMPAFVAWSSLFAPAPLLILSFLFEGEASFRALSHPTLMMLGTSLYLGAIATIGGFGMWSALLSRYPASLVAPFSLCVPVFGFLWGFIILGERITLFEALGAIIIALGLTIHVFGPQWIHNFFPTAKETS